jgi:hypothetical protein
MGDMLCRLAMDNRPYSPGPEWWLLLDLAIHADDDTGYTAPGYGYMAARTRAPHSTIYRWLRKLREDGWIRIARKAASGGRSGAPGRPTVYQVQIPPKMESDPPWPQPVTFAPEPDVCAQGDSPLEIEEDLSDLIAETLGDRTDPDIQTALYRYYDDQDRLLYIGISGSLWTRVTAHVKASSWMDFAARSTITRYPTRPEAEEAEEVAIKAEHPIFNDQHNRTPETQRRLVEYLIEHDRLDLLAPAVSRG